MDICIVTCRRGTKKGLEYPEVFPLDDDTEVIDAETGYGPVTAVRFLDASGAEVRCRAPYRVEEIDGKETAVPELVFEKLVKVDPSEVQGYFWRVQLDRFRSDEGALSFERAQDGNSRRLLSE